MTDLSWALSIAGAVVLAAVVAHGVWTSRRAGPKRAEPRATAVEPMLEETGAPATSPPDADGRTEPGFGPDAELDAVLRAAQRRQAARLDALIDAIAVLKVEQPVPAGLAFASLPTTRRAGSKPVLIEGLNTETGEWEPPHAPPPEPGSRVRYSEFQVGVQMANRTGALNEIEYSEFVQKVQAFADGVGAMVELPDMLDVVARARELDAFAGQHDAQLAVHLRALNEAGWSLAYVQQQAAKHGFIPGPVPGRLVLPSPDEGAPPVLTLAYDAQAALADDPAQAVVHGVMLSFDVPQTPAAADPFAVWQTTAHELAASMDAAVVDDNGYPLAPQGFDAIKGELAKLYEKLEARDLAAGSAVGRRLFS